MPDYVFKAYLADGREHFLYGEMGDSQAQLTKKDFPFPESLLRLLYLDIWAYDGQIKQFDKLLMELYRTREEKCARQLLPLLDELAELHIYFQLLRLDWRACRSFSNRHILHTKHKIPPRYLHTGPVSCSQIPRRKDAGTCKFLCKS